LEKFQEKLQTEVELIDKSDRHEES